MSFISQFEISVSARGLTVINDPEKQSSLRCALFVSTGLIEKFIETDKTEFNEDCVNPDWSKKFMISFKFTEIKALRFDTFLGQNKMGETKISLLELLSAKDGFTMKSIKYKNEKIGKLLIRYEECQHIRETISMQFSGKNLDKKDMFGHSDPYLVISNIDGNGNTTEVYKSEVVKQSLSPVWKPIKIRARTLCQSDYEMKLKFDCYDWDSNIKVKDKIDSIGSFTTTLNQLILCSNDDNTYELINSNKLAQNLDSYQNSGLICLENISVTFDESFLDYLRNGLQFNVNIAIDFTSALNIGEIKTLNQRVSNETNDSNIFESFIKNFYQIIKQYNKQNIWKASGFNAVFGDNLSNDYYDFSENGFYENYEQIITKFDSLLTTTKILSNKSINLGPTVDKSVEWIEKLVESDSIKNSRYSVLFILTSNLTKDNLKNMEDIIEKTNSVPISVFIVDINLSGNPKDLKEINKMMKKRRNLENRNNVEVISIQSLNESNDWQNLINKTVMDIINRIPDHFMKYITFIEK